MAASHTPKLPARLASLTLAALVACTVDPGTTTEGAGSTTDATTAEPPTTTTPTAGTDDPSTGEPTGDPTGDPLPPAEVPQGCNPIAYEADCMLPYPSDWFTVPDASLPGGLRVALSPEATPKTLEGVAIDNLLAHPADGFSQHMPILALFPAGIDTTGLTFHLDGGDATLSATSPTLLLNADTGELVPHWVELDAMTDDPKKQALIVRPFVRLTASTRYIVAFQGLTAASGERVAPPLGFAHLLQGDVAGHPLLETLATRYEAEIFPALTKLGVARDDLQLAWDFTTASDERNTRDMWAIRDDIVATLGQAGPALEVDLVLPEYSDEIALRVEGRIEVPLYLEADEPMAWLHRDGKGNVVANGTHWVPFTFQIPTTAFPTEPGFEPLRIIQFGHGFFGEREEINWSAMRAFSSERRVAMIATEWVGMAADDQGAVVQTIFDDPANVFLFTDRLHQGFANQLALSYAIQTTLADAEAMSAFKQLLYDPDQLYWYGISQGSIFGATFMALTPTIEKAVLDVGGGPYSLMMTRSGSFSDLFSIVKVVLGDEPLTVQKFIAMSQHTWDRVDPITYAPRVLQDPPKDSPPRTVLFSFGVGDHSVTNVASHLLLRALGIDLLAPAAKEVYGLGTVPAPTAGSAAVVVDFMYPNPAGIEAKLPDPPPDEENVHEGVRRNPKIRDMIDAFLRPGGQIENFCDGPCDPE
ncbi:hypothetical protein [Nannocystis sp.]|uniref:hypothetical protein n=1 Tax=Nannocystis sp. TaxID=1962667 RepID=UPI002423680C|nr:hypothetical protein [Nannocystis sp.]MBK7827982.1 hypothetical protein [Nannocystis sp.]MBK9752492.1 hypothetical protein [Nannocystis sp.]